ncbi:MAG TPA: hypothetical protein VH206_12660 [Xanthobacteraceae bacterium]|jgi:hypothetical protein|nr:hypothetical protein [Xanthobacteraceae bacterium]
MLAIQNLPIGAKVRLCDNEAEAQIIDNPGDGVWLLVRRLTPGAQEELCHVDELIEII